MASISPTSVTKFSNILQKHGNSGLLHCSVISVLGHLHAPQTAFGAFVARGEESSSEMLGTGLHAWPFCFLRELENEVVASDSCRRDAGDYGRHGQKCWWHGAWDEAQCIIKNSVDDFHVAAVWPQYWGSMLSSGVTSARAEVRNVLKPANQFMPASFFINFTCFDVFSATIFT